MPRTWQFPSSLATALPVSASPLSNVSPITMANEHPVALETPGGIPQTQGIFNLDIASSQATFTDNENEAEIPRTPGKTIVVGPCEDRRVNRKLKAINLFVSQKDFATRRMMLNWSR